MKKIILLIICIVFVCLNLKAQDTVPSNQEIEMKIKLLGYRFYKDGERLTWKELVTATESVETANKLIKRAKSQRFISNSLAFTGGFLIGIPIGQKSNDLEPKWEFAYLGGAIALVGLHLSFRTFNNVNDGIDTYNIAVNKTAMYRFQPEFHLVGNQNGLGLAMRF